MAYNGKWDESIHRISDPNGHKTTACRRSETTAHKMTSCIMIPLHHRSLAIGLRYQPMDHISLTHIYLPRYNYVAITIIAVLLSLNPPGRSQYLPDTDNSTWYSQHTIACIKSLKDQVYKGISCNWRWGVVVCTLRTFKTKFHLPLLDINFMLAPHYIPSEHVPRHLLRCHFLVSWASRTFLQRY